MEAPVENGASQKKNPTKKKGKIANRFSDEQIKSLESIFKEDSKLEPSRKLQIARDLGLHQRQVAIWFQNRRARWKSKQIEQDYKVLKANYDDLYAQTESLVREKQSLQIQLQELKNRLKNNHNENFECKEISGCLDSLVVDPNGLMHEDGEEKISHYFGHGEEGEIMSLDGGDSSPLISSENWCNLCSEGMFDHSGETSNWWETV